MLCSKTEVMNCSRCSDRSSGGIFRPGSFPVVRRQVYFGPLGTLAHKNCSSTERRFLPRSLAIDAGAPHGHAPHVPTRSGVHLVFLRSVCNLAQEVHQTELWHSRRCQCTPSGGSLSLVVVYLPRAAVRMAVKNGILGDTCGSPQNDELRRGGPSPERRSLAHPQSLAFAPPDSARCHGPAQPHPQLLEVPHFSMLLRAQQASFAVSSFAPTSFAAKSHRSSWNFVELIVVGSDRCLRAFPSSWPSRWFASLLSRCRPRTVC